VVADNDKIQERSPIWDDHYIKLKVDISGTQKMSKILGEVEEYVKSSRYICNITEPDERLTIDQDVFEVWDLHVQGKNRIEIIRTVWPDEYSAEFGNPDDGLWEREYKELGTKYRKAEIINWDEKAYNETYAKNERTTSGKIRLYTKVGDKIRRMNKLMEEFNPS
jgi:hypothetical protein